MKQYFKNILRAIAENKTSYIGVISIIALGIFIYTSMADVMLNLNDKVNTYFDNYGFADVFANVKAMPADQVEHLRDIEGIDEAFGRLSGDVRLLLDGTNEIITLHVLSYDKNDTLNMLNASLSSDELSDNTFLLGSKMFDSYKLNIHDKFRLIAGDEIKTFTLAGTVKAPEYIYAVPSSGAQLQDSRIYDIACMKREELENLLGKRGMVTELGFKLKNGYTFDDVKYELTERLGHYSMTNLSDRKNQTSSYRLNEELNQLSSMITAVPAIFMVISVFMMYIVLKKMIDKERTLIGTMKSFGFSDRQLMLAYMKQSIGIGVLGGLIGGILSIPLGGYIFDMYKDFFNLPYDNFKCYASTKLLGTAIATITSIIAVYTGIRGILKINPAEAMRQSAPVLTFNAEIPSSLSRYLNSKQRMAIRNLYRNRLRSFIIMLAVALPFSLTSVLASFPDVAEQIFFNQFTKIQTYDLQITFSGYQKYNAALSAAEQIDGTYGTEGIVRYDVTIKNGNISKRTALTGLNRNSEIYRIMDIHNKYYTPPDNGILMNSALAKKLNVSEGDTVNISSSFLSPADVTVSVINIIEESFGESCYIDIHAIPKFFNTSLNADSVIFKVGNEKMDDVKKVLKEAKNISAVTDAKRTLEGYRDMMQSMLGIMNVFFMLSIVAGIILIYSISDISMSERKNEFGTLGILGMTNREIIEIICYEQGINFLAGIIIGFPMSLVFKKFIGGIIATDLYTIDLKIFPSSYLMSFFICIGIMALSSAFVLKKLKNIDLTDILKGRE